MRKQEAESSFEVRGMSEEFRGMSEEFRGKSEEFRGKSEEVRGKRNEVGGLLALTSSLLALPSPLLAPRSTLLALFSSLLALRLLALPSSLSPLENGLQFNGSNWIETGYCPTASDRFECEVTVNAVQPNASAAVFGTVREQEPERTFAFYVRQGGDDSSVVAYGGAARGGFFPRGKKVSLTVGPDGATWTWDGGSDRLLLTPGFALDGVTPLLIGDANTARNVGDSVPAGTGAAMTLHRFRIWRGGLELVHDYVPCRNTTGEEGLYDTVTDDFLPIKGGTPPTPPEPEPPVITSIEIDQANDVVRVGVATKPGVTYALLRSPTVAPRTSYTTEVARAVADAETMTLTDETPDRPKSQAFYIVEAK